MIFSLGALVVIAQHLGAGREQAARRATVTVLRASSILGIGMALLIAAGSSLIVSWLQTPEEIAPDAIAYLLIVAAGLAFNAYIVAATAVLRAWGKTLAILAMGFVMNILDVVLLGTFLLVLELGAVGAALPTLVVRGVGVVLLMWLVRTRTGVGMFSSVPRERSGEAKRMAKLSIPTVIENAAYNGAIVVTVSMINVLGVDAINARSYALTLTALVTGVVLAMAQGNETIVGWDVGDGGVWQRRMRTLRTAIWTAVACALLTFGLWLVAEPALAIFGANETVVTVAKSALLISAVLLPLSAFTTVVYGALRSTGDVLIPMAYSVAASVLVLAPLSWLLIRFFGWGLDGMFWALGVTEAVRATLLVGRWMRGSWMRSIESRSQGLAEAGEEEESVEPVDLK